jgi:hypothetical protein
VTSGVALEMTRSLSSLVPSANSTPLAPRSAYRAFSFCFFFDFLFAEKRGWSDST